MQKVDKIWIFSQKFKFAEDFLNVVTFLFNLLKAFFLEIWLF